MTLYLSCRRDIDRRDVMADTCLSKMKMSISYGLPQLICAYLRRVGVSTTDSKSLHPGRPPLSRRGRIPHRVSPLVSTRAHGRARRLLRTHLHPAARHQPPSHPAPSSPLAENFPPGRETV